MGKITYKDIKIIFEDNHILVVEKPQGILSQRDNSDSQDMLTLLKEYLRVKYNKPGEAFLGLVQRLDMNTGGVMVFAKTSKAASRLSEDIRNGMLIKKYYAVLCGVPEEKEKTLTGFITKDHTKNISRLNEEGKPVKLHYSVLFSRNGYSLAEIQLFSGRSHQIRVQMSDAGYPLAGDVKYGGNVHFPIKGLQLWAHEIQFRHPTVIETEVIGEEKKRKEMIFRSEPLFLDYFK